MDLVNMMDLLDLVNLILVILVIRMNLVTNTEQMSRIADADADDGDAQMSR